MDTAMSLIFTIAATVISSMILFFMKKYLKTNQKREEQSDRAKAKEGELILRSLKAQGKLTVANSIALRDGKTNGEMTAALDEYEKTNKELYQYLISVYTEKW